MLPTSYKVLWEHLPLALGNGVCFSLFYENWACLLTSLLLGWLVDADHLFDFFICVYKKQIELNVHNFLQGQYFRKSHRVILPFHAYEWAVMLLLLSSATLFSDDTRIVLMCGSLSLFCHLFQDQLANNVHAKGYFIIFRFLKRFHISAICKQTH